MPRQKSSHTGLRFGIKSISIVEVHFKLNYEPAGEGKVFEISTNIGIDYKKDGKSVEVLLSLTSDSTEQPFVFAVRARGMFEFSRAPRKAELDRVARINCASIIFPYVRETVADLTRRAGVAPLHLAPVNFVALYEEWSGQK